MPSVSPFRRSRDPEGSDRAARGLPGSEAAGPEAGRSEVDGRCSPDEIESDRSERDGAGSQYPRRRGQVAAGRGDPPDTARDLA